MSAADNPELAGVFKRPFSEQLAFWRAKLGNQVPTARWDDLWKSQHDRAFMVAGAMKADLLADLAAAVDRAIADGVGIGQFRKDFDAIVAKHVWAYTGERNWRARVIYRTNAATSYAAGRLAQLRAGGFKLWMYKHGGSLDPRPQHLAWDGLVLPPDHPFWETHAPPNGWGCSCRIVGVRSKDVARRLGGDPDKSLPDGWDAIDPRTGEPRGIDRGWAYQPGATVVVTVRSLAAKLEALPAPASIAVIQQWLRADAFEQWFADPEGEFPLVRLPDADARAIGAGEGIRVAYLSAESAMKQRNRHPEIGVSDYAFAQRVVDQATAKAIKDSATGARSAIFVQEDERFVLVVKATIDRGALFVTSFYRLPAAEARRKSEIRRLLRQGREG